jgi:transcriptional regulator GlxA family with amidase domain
MMHIRFSRFKLFASLVLSQILWSCNDPTPEKRVLPQLIPNGYNVAILIMDGVYNTELTAPYDIFHHTRFREGIQAMNVFTVADKLDPVLTFEGLRIIPDYNWLTDSLPSIDILVVPSAEHHLDTDLQNDAMIAWVKKTGHKAKYVTSHCDGAFVLATAGLLDGHASTTFPTDIKTYKEMFPQLEVVSDVLFVHDGKFITSAGGAKSFEAALYLCELLYGEEVAQSLAGGLVIDWNLDSIAHHVVER